MPPLTDDAYRRSAPPLLPFAPFNVVQREGEEVRYACMRHRSMAACINKFTVLQKRLEIEILPAISESLGDPATMSDLRSAYQCQVASFWDEEEKALAQ